MAEHAKHRGTGSGGRRRGPVQGLPPHRTPGRRKPPQSRPTLPTVPAVAGLATFMVAASGALTLESADSGDSVTEVALPNRAMPAGLALTVDQLQGDRSEASDQSSRGGRGDSDLDTEALDEARAELRSEARERLAWEAEHTAELAKLSEQAEAFLDEQQQVLVRAEHWVRPLTGYRIVAHFGDVGRLWSGVHTGTDLSARSGTALYAIGAGSITFTGWDGSYGRKLVLTLDDGTELWYAHLSRFASTSGRVEPGDVVGYVGSTGNSTGPHLHLEVRPNGGDPIDPLPWLRGLGLPI